MKTIFTILFLFAFGAVCAQDKKVDSLKFDIKPRLYIIQPCFCPVDGTIKINPREYDPNNPYGDYKGQKPIVLKPSDSLLEVGLKNGWIVRKTDTVPVL